MTPIAPDWIEMNQQALARAMGGVRARLLRHAAHASGTAPAAAEPADAAGGADTAAPPALDRLCAAFGLTPFEREVVLLCAGMELDSAFASACELAQNHPQLAYPTFGLALAALPAAHWSALLPEAPLRYWRLVELAAGGSPSAPLTTRPIRIDERILHYLTGLTHLDERLGCATPLAVAHPPVPSHAAIADRLHAAWARAGERGAVPPVISLHGADAASARAIAAAACTRAGWTAYVLADRFVPAAAAELVLFARLCEREFRLDRTVLVVDCESGGAPDGRDGALAEFLDRVRVPVIVIGRERARPGSRPLASFEVTKPTSAEQRDVWCHALSGVQATPGAVAALTAQFSLGVGDVHAAVEEAAAHDGTAPTLDVLWAACRQHSRGRLEDLAQRIEAVARLDDLVLPDDQKEILQDIVVHVRQRATVHETWGFARAGSRGLGIAALFAGASGTGKTMAAEVLARALDLDLYRVDLSAVVSKYIGETEKNLRRIFDAADGGGVILLFDEADALFGKRSEVKDSHDRYANIEVSYLLQRMESYRGLAILTTNLKTALDTAFLRRLRFIVQFPFPDVAQRAEIWRRVFPADTPTERLDVHRLAQLSVAGGSIRNVALKAAFLAADAREAVGMAHVLRAARSEYAKLEKPLTDAEVAGWQ